MTLRSGNACHLLVALLTSFGAAVPTARAQDRALAGQVVDGRGVGLAGATVFVTELVRSPRAAEAAARPRLSTSEIESGDRVLRSGPDGSFGAQVPPGRYRIAVFKPGYDVGLAEFSMATRSLIEVRMRPAHPSTPDTAREPSGGDAGLNWILRRSDGDELREIVAGAAVATNAGSSAGPPGGGTVPAALRWRMPNLNGELKQDFSGSDLLAGEASGPGDASGRSTRLALHGPAGEDGAWRFDGRSGRTTAGLPGGEEARRGGATTGLGIGFDYRLGPEDDLRTAVLYSSRRYLFASSEAAGDVDQTQRSAAVHARWDRTLTDDALLFVAGSCRQAAFDQPAAGPRTAAPAFAPAGAAERGVDRWFDATAGLALSPEGHAIDLGLRVRAFRFDLGDGGALLSDADSGALPLEPAADGLVMTLFGGDDWRLTDRSTVNYGLRYHGDPSSGGAYLVPRVGLTTTLAEVGDLVVHSAVMYRVEDNRPASPLAVDAYRRDPGVESNRLGYEIGVTGRPDDRLQFAATLSYRPFQEGMDGRTVPLAPGEAPEESLLILSDATAGRHEMEVEVQRGFGFVQGAWLGSVGRVQGLLAPVLGDGPVVEAATGQARYYLTGLRATIQPTETEVRIDYRSVLGETAAPESGGGASLRYRRVDLAVLQALPFSPFASSRWKIRMAYQGLLLDSVDGVAPWPGSGATSRLSGGVDIAF
jgi:hypothetical protein